MEEHEYIVTVADPTVWDTGFWEEMTEDGLGDNFVPTRQVMVANERPFNEFSAHFNLTKEEANQLSNDPRVVAVELHTDPRREKGFLGIRNARYSRANSITVADKNWGLLRCISDQDPFGSATNLIEDYTFNLDGTGVDIVVIDSGVEADHPEFAVNADGTGGSRVVDFDWSSLGVPGCPTSASIGGYLGDTDGHGSNCASIAAGNTCGWATGAAIYSIRIFSGSNIITGSFQGVIDDAIAFDLVKAFHLQKKAQGNTRPTICSNSWGYFANYSNMASTTFRGVSQTTFSRQSSLGQVAGSHGFDFTSLNAAVDSCASVGVIMTGAAGNSRHKCDVPGGIDYDNFWLETGDPFQIFYHRGGSPTNASSMICVGAVDNDFSTGTEQASTFSEKGPRVDIWSPGELIMGAYANSPYQFSAVADPRDTRFHLNKISGTSQATPQVTGVLACLLQLRPTANKEELLKLIKSGPTGLLNEAGSESFTNLRHLQGSENKLLKMPFTNAKRGGISS
jgi:subtilisin family serine protease